MSYASNRIGAAPRRGDFSLRTAGVDALTRGLKTFNSRDRILIIGNALRATLKPGVGELKAATPRSSGRPHEIIQRRKARRGWKTTPAHAALSARVRIQRFARDGAMVGRLGYGKGFDWYMQILSSGRYRASPKVAGRKFAHTIVHKHRRLAETALPARIGEHMSRRIAINARKRAKRLDRGR